MGDGSGDGGGLAGRCGKRKVVLVIWDEELGGGEIACPCMCRSVFAIGLQNKVRIFAGENEKKKI